MFGEDPIEKRSALRKAMLAELYRSWNDGNFRGLNLHTWGAGLGIDSADIAAARSYLLEKNWARMSGSLGAVISGQGINEYERLQRSNPEIPTSLVITNSQDVQITYGNNNNVAMQQIPAVDGPSSFSAPRKILDGPPEYSRFTMSPFGVDMRGEYGYAPFPYLIAGLRPGHVNDAKVKREMLLLRDFPAREVEQGTIAYQYLRTQNPTAEDLPSLVGPD